MRETHKRTLESTKQKISEAIEYLQKYEPVRGYWLAFSGGKDSIVIRKLSDLAGVKYVAGYSRTGIDPPELVSFIKRNYPNTVFHKPKKSFYQLVTEKKPPLISARWCCEHIKEFPGKEEKQKYPIHIVGIRAEESYKRAMRPRLDLMVRIKSIVIKPILHWKEYHVWK